MAAIEAFGQTQNRREFLDHAPALARQISVVLVVALRRRAPVIPCHERDDIDFVGLETAQVAVLDQVIRVFVVPFVADMRTDVVKQRRVFEPFPLAVG